MSIAGDMLNAGMTVLVNHHSMESVTIAGTAYDCFVMASVIGTDYELGGFTNQDSHQLAIPRSLITSIPTEGAAVTFRSTSYRVARVQRDDAEAAIVVQIVATTSKGQT
jgi:hypothetical protein